LPSGDIFEAEIVEQRDGFVSVLLTGHNARKLFSLEAGGHRWQRIPPTEKRGRRHTSTVTVAVLDPEAAVRYKLDLSQVDIKATRGSGPGGQHRNKTDSCIVAKHKPTGVTVRVDMKSQHQSRTMALEILAAKLLEAQAGKKRQGRDAQRKQQVGSGMRGDKIRTYREQDDKVVDHRTGRSWQLKKWKRGQW